VAWTIQTIRACLPTRHDSLMFTVERTRITEEDIERYMMTNLAGSPPLDILVRSSGVKRLSDFLMWQVWLAARGTEWRVTHGLILCRRRKTCSCISLLRIGRILGFGTCFPLFWITRPRFGANKAKPGTRICAEHRSRAPCGVLTINCIPIVHNSSNVN
jgi:hypothetical protein